MGINSGSKEVEEDGEDVEDEPVFDPNEQCGAILEMMYVEGNIQLKGDNFYAKPHLEYTFNCWHYLCIPSVACNHI